MQKIFIKTIQSFVPNISIDIINHHWQMLAKNYQQSNRFYHNFIHIESLLHYFDKIQNQFYQPNMVLLAIFYHDSIYQTETIQSISNEQQSVDFLINTWQSMISDDILQLVKTLILATETHQIPTNIDKKLANDLALFLDMDLSILGSSTLIYQRYAQQIRQEYAHITDDVYRQGRTKVLQNFLQRPRLYFSETFFQQLETQARQNMMNEIKLLSSA